MDVESIFTDTKKRKKTIGNEFLYKLQKEHFVRFQIMPPVVALLSLPLLPYLPFGPFEIFLFIFFWMVTGFGITSGYHRLFTHRSYKARPWVQAVLAVMGAMAGQGGVISWSALHRRHHECSDKPGDPHSPNLNGESVGQRLRGLVHSHLTWMYKHEYPSVVHYTPDLIKNKLLLRVDQYYYWWAWLGLGLPAVMAGIYHGSWTGAIAGFLWGGIFRMIWGGHTIWSINSLLHCFGISRFNTEEFSHNFGPAALLTFGESWHNNHHAFPASASFGLEWYRLDPGYWFIQALAAFGLAWDVQVPNTERIQARLSKARAAAS